MQHIIELKEELNKMSDELLLRAFTEDSEKFGRFNFYPVFASRINRFKNLIFDELINSENIEIQSRTVKPSWIIGLSVFDYCSDLAVIKEMINLIKENWASEDYNQFVDYISKDKRFEVLFKKL